MQSEKLLALKELQQIPRVGKTIANDLWNLEIRKISDLKGRKPERLYKDLCKYQECRVDLCMLYVFRCAVYYASTEECNKDLLKWWNWKDR